MNSFGAIDFETANNECTSVCSVGVVIVRDGEFVDSFYSLIQPEPNYYLYWLSFLEDISLSLPFWHFSIEDDTVETTKIFGKSLV